MTFKINILGGPELQKALADLPKRIEKNVTRGALRAGAKAVRAQIKPLIPKGEPSDTNKRRYGVSYGNLSKTLRHGSDGRGRLIKGYVRVGGKRGKRRKHDAFYANWVEYGTKPHVIPKKAGKRLKMRIRDKFRMGPFSHPGAKPQPFMRPGMIRGRTPALRAAGSYFQKRLSSRNLTFALRSEPDGDAE